MKGVDPSYSWTPRTVTLVGQFGNNVPSGTGGKTAKSPGAAGVAAQVSISTAPSPRERIGAAEALITVGAVIVSY